MQSQTNSHPAITRPAVVGALEVLPNPLSKNGGRMSRAALSVDYGEGGDRTMLDWQELVLSGSSEMPIYVLALVTGDTAFYLMFNLADCLTRDALSLARRNRKLHLDFADGCVSVRGALYEHRATQGHDAKVAAPEDWMQHAISLSPLLPKIISLGAPGFRHARNHAPLILVDRASFSKLHSTVFAGAGQLLEGSHVCP